jgi:hypothetical protein
MKPVKRAAGAAEWKAQLELFPNLPTVLDPMRPIRWWVRHQRYIKSDRWHRIREKTFRLADYQCQHYGPRCQGSLNLQCHHVKPYFGYEQPGVDTMCVCGNCHHDIHYPPADNDNEPV